MISNKGNKPTRSNDIPMIDEEVQEGGSQVLENMARIPMLGRARWQIKGLEPPKYNGSVASCTTNAIEQWLSKWEQCFRLCDISDDVSQHGIWQVVGRRNM